MLCDPLKSIRLALRGDVHPRGELISGKHCPKVAMGPGAAEGLASRRWSLLPLPHGVVLGNWLHNDLGVSQPPFSGMYFKTKMASHLSFLPRELQVPCLPVTHQKVCGCGGCPWRTAHHPPQISRQDSHAGSWQPSHLESLLPTWEDVEKGRPPCVPFSILCM